MIVTLEHLKKNLISHRAVLVTGGFDPLHFGHIRYILEAALRATPLDLVVVGVAPDSYIIRKHPVLQSLQHRMEMVDGIKGVDYVAPQEEDTAAAIIRAVRPRVFLKGDDWKVRGLPGAEVKALEDTGTRVEYVPIQPISSSDLLNNFFWTRADEMGRT